MMKQGRWIQDFSSLGCILILAIILRLQAVAYFETHLGDPGAYEHGVIAENLARDRGFQYGFYAQDPQPTSHQAPAVAFILSIMYRLFGVGSVLSFLAYQFFNVALGVFAVLSIYFAALQISTKRIALLAALGLALYPPFIYMSTRIQSINWTIPWLLAALALQLYVLKRRSLLAAALSGAAAALGCLGEPILAVPFALGWFWLLWRHCLRGRDARRGVLLGLLSAVAVVVILTPWCWRNYRVHDRFVGVKGSFWYVFWQGNHEGASGTDKLEPDADLRERLAWSWGGKDLENDLRKARAQAVSVDTALSPEDIQEICSREAEIDKMDWFRDRAQEELRAHPAAFAEMCVRRLVLTLWFDSTNPRTYVLAYRAPALAVTLLCVAGLFLLRPARRDALVLLGLYFLGLVAVFVLVITSARFRLVLEALAMLPAAVSVHAMFQLSGISRLVLRILDPAEE